MKEPIRKVVGKPQRETGGEARASAEAKRHRSHGTPPLDAPPTVTGQTVFHDRPLRFRTLTVAEPDFPALEHPSAIEGAFKIRVAKRSRSRHDAHKLVEMKYASRGYIRPSANFEARVHTFIAYDEGQIVGTVGVGLESVKRLSADDHYHLEIDRLRAKGYQLCEFTRLAVDRSAVSKAVLAGLFHTAYLFASKIRGRTHAVIEVNPRHVLFYARELKFEQVGPERRNTRVNAPAVLLCASFETIAEGLTRYGGKRPTDGKRTLFHYGFPPDEESGVLNRLRKLVPQS
jgi:hypothetical protein